MNSVGIIGLAIVALVLLVYAIGVQRLLRLRWQPIGSAPVNRADIPEARLKILEQAAPDLAALGFNYLSSGVTQTAVVTPADLPVYFDVYRHADHATYVLVTPSPMPEHQQPCVLQFITCFDDASQWITLNCFRHNSPIDLPRWRVFDDYLPTWQQALQRHTARVQAASVPVCTDSAELLRRLHQSFAELVPYMQQSGQLQAVAQKTHPNPNPHLRLTWAAAMRLTAVALVGQWRAGRAVSADRAGNAASNLPATTAQQGSTSPESDADLAAYQAHRSLHHGAPSSSRTKWLVFGISALLFLGVGGFWLSWSFVPIVLAVVALHEGGHYLAMRLTGYRNVSVFFLPGLGGLAVGEKATATPMEKLLVYLAGPVPGIALAGVAFWASASGWWTAPPWLNAFLIASLVINYLNLLPIVPLDGGRVLETFLFARAPRLRLGFAVLCCGLLFGLGHWLDDMVLRVVAVLIAFGLPHQWRVMQLDLATQRPVRAALDESQAVQALFAGLQALPGRTWSFAQRSAAVTTLLPELMGRKARRWESAVGLALYAVVLCAPVAVAWVAVPQFGFLASAFNSALIPGLQVPADDVEPAPVPTAAPKPELSPADWEARLAKLAQAPALPDAERLMLLLGAGKAANDSEDTDAAMRHYRAAWAIAQHLPARELLRIDALEGLASLVEPQAERVALLNQIVDELTAPQGEERLRVAWAKEQLSYGELEPAAQVALLQDAVRLRAAASTAQNPVLLGTRLVLARALDQANFPLAAEAELTTRIESLTLPERGDRTREALHRGVQRVLAQVDLAWFLMAHQRHADAQRTVSVALASVPAQITVSWVYPQQQALEAAVWAEVLAPSTTELRRSWDAYEAARKQGFGGSRPTLAHEADRAVVAQALKDAGLQNQAQRGMAQVRAQLTRRPALCEAVAPYTQTNWRQPQQDARRRVLQASGNCNH
ncbi:MAG: site-2 protease family protein [Burkholderiales bacterium]|nr:site-2 protease family protein [Burkholderiales bacterium]